ncbi:MAG: hypothetical protein ACKOWF_09340 [Chloroflexota bacterium]
MALMAYWTFKAYQNDMAAGWDLSFNSRQRRLHTAISPGERLWIVGPRPAQGGWEYVLRACLWISELVENGSEHPYGPFGVIGDSRFSAEFAPDGPEMSEVLLALEFAPRKPIKSRAAIAMSLQTIRSLSAEDDVRLLNWAKSLQHVALPDFE